MEEQTMSYKQHNILQNIQHMRETLTQKPLSRAET